MDRAALLLRDLTKADRLIEVGPSFNPLAPKRHGWNAFTIDHAPREALVEKYAAHFAVDLSLIEEVDFVWQGGSLADAIPADRHGTFDAFLASHVIEHTTDIVTSLKAAETLLRPDGVIVLAIPDKRKCFDFYRHPSTTADAVVAFLEKRQRHDRRTQFDYASRMALKGGGPGWHSLDMRNARLANTLEAAPQWLAAAASPAYIDAHNWVFVPASFQLIVVELVAMGYLDLRVRPWSRRTIRNSTPGCARARCLCRKVSSRSAGRSFSTASSSNWPNSHGRSPEAHFTTRPPEARLPE